ncbi:phosphatase 2C-like domain-containing protein [Lasiosphaeria ovina]|uniref:Phosphatase 2C-like domain-containing protein n=1 Tax=Lasiosphaeria ovina TaxID=92902 RepID=A0AAE0KII8_9PEZI|nr:phosphatase 2C-like domain-containing protein [Lasiosphaeria ovina]
MYWLAMLPGKNREYWLVPSTQKSLSTNPHAARNKSPKTAIPLALGVLSFAPVVDASNLASDASVAALSHRMAESNHKTLAFPNPERLAAILREHEETVAADRENGVVRYDVVQVPCNDPIEDDHSEAIVQAPPIERLRPGREEVARGEWMFWGIYDGHGGWPTAAKLRQSLISYVCSSLEDEYTAHSRSSEIPSDENIVGAIKKAFLALDHDIVWSSLDRFGKTAASKQLAAQALAPAISGSCALLSLYDTDTQLLRVAYTGDSRAVLGRRADDGTWSTAVLSVDQTCGNPDEADRIRAAHPGEEAGVIKGGRIYGGLEPARAFGDASYKWGRDTSLALRKSSFARKPLDSITSPPYVTAEPVVTTTKVHPDKGDFVVMACDGLWETLSNEEVVGLVGRWIDNGGLGSGDTKNGRHQPSWGQWWPSYLSWPPSPSGSETQPPSVTADSTFGKPPHRPGQWEMDLKQRTFVYEDSNAATHLARNALGANNHDLMGSLFMLQGSNARRFRDDLTITVIFFGDGQGSKVTTSAS